MVVSQGGSVPVWEAELDVEGVEVEAHGWYVRVNLGIHIDKERFDEIGVVEEYVSDGVNLNGNDESGGRSEVNWRTPPLMRILLENVMAV